MNFDLVNPCRFLPAVVFLAFHTKCNDSERKNIHENNKLFHEGIGRIILLLPTKIASNYNIRYSLYVYINILSRVKTIVAIVYFFRDTRSNTAWEDENKGYGLCAVNELSSVVHVVFLCRQRDVTTRYLTCLHKNVSTLIVICIASTSTPPYISEFKTGAINIGRDCGLPTTTTK